MQKISNTFCYRKLFFHKNHIIKPGIQQARERERKPHFFSPKRRALSTKMEEWQFIKRQNFNRILFQFRSPNLELICVIETPNHRRQRLINWLFWSVLSLQFFSLGGVKPYDFLNVMNSWQWPEVFRIHSRYQNIFLDFVKQSCQNLERSIEILWINFPILWIKFQRNEKLKWVKLEFYK